MSCLPGCWTENSKSETLRNGRPRFTSRLGKPAVRLDFPPVINLPVQPAGGGPGGTNRVIQQPNNPVDDPIVMTPEPGTSLLGLGLLLILIFQKNLRRTG